MKMSITVERFLDISNDYKIKTIAGEAGLNNIAEWFHFIGDEYELQFTNEKELVFCSGQYLQEEAVFLQVVTQLVERKASGLVVGVGHYIKEVPQSVLQFCNEHQFPLLKIASGANISDVVKLFCLQILESEKANRQLFSAMKNAISFPQKTELYTPTFLQYGFLQE